jgi:hypothetical protein
LLISTLEKKGTEIAQKRCKRRAAQRRLFALAADSRHDGQVRLGRRRCEEASQNFGSGVAFANGYSTRFWCVWHRIGLCAWARMGRGGGGSSLLDEQYARKRETADGSDSPESLWAQRSSRRISMATDAGRSGGSAEWGSSLRQRNPLGRHAGVESLLEPAGQLRCCSKIGRLPTVAVPRYSPLPTPRADRSPPAELEKSFSRLDSFEACAFSHID